MTYQRLKDCLYYSVLLAFMLFYQSSHAQDFRPVGIWMNEHIQELGGRAVLLVYKDGKLIYSNTVNDLNRKQAFVSKMIARKTGKDPKQSIQDYDSKSKIAIASCSKWLSAALVMTFVDEGKLQLADTVGKFLPILSAHGQGNISIRDCLTHQTGIRSGELKDGLKLNRESNNMDEAIAAIANLDMEAAPGTSFHYSNTGLQIAAAVIEKSSGKDFETLFAERIAQPCNMLQTDFGHKKVPLPAGGAQSTAEDYLKFLSMVLHNGEYEGRRILSQQSISLMQQNYTIGKKIIYSPAEAGDWGYGLGEWTMGSGAGGRSSSITSPGLFGTFPWIDNDRQYAAVLFCFNLQSKGRHENYMELKRLVDLASTNTLQ